MSIFGQVWVFSAAAFVLGALLAWFFLVRPMKRRVRELEHLPSPPEAGRPVGAERAQDTRKLAAGRASTFDEEPAAPPQSTRYFQPDPRPEPALDPAEVTQHIAPAPSWPERDSLQDYRAAQSQRVEADDFMDDYRRFEALADRTGPAGHDDQIGQPGHTGQAPGLAGLDAGGASHGEVREQPDTGADDARPEAGAGAPGPRRNSLFEPVPFDGEGEEDRDEPDISRAEQTVADGPPAYAFGGPDAGAGPEEDPAERTQVLPKREPRRPLPGGFEPPKPIQPSIRPVVRREAADEQASTHSGSLFEPTVAPSGSAPPARQVATSANDLPSGPFGPGSAMPGPDGAPPSEDFTVKANVTSLRYCPPESPQFPQMVAEVWFRSSTDAERVGFRPFV